MITRRDALALPLASLLAFDTPFLFALDDDTDPTRFFTGDKKPTDARLLGLRTLDSNFPFLVPKSKEGWEARKKTVRERLLVANGLWPMPEKTPLNPVIHGKIQRDGYTIEKVYFASTPGHYVSGNLYRPAGESKSPRPGVLFAHGHWANGRLHDAGEKAAKDSVASKGEPDLERGRFFMQAIPVTLARLGFVVFQYDMVGVGDSLAVPHAQGFADVQGELRLQSAMGLQTWNSIRALDFIAALPDVDPKRLGMTGASGGGTQTFITAAVDDRLAAAFPAVMVSTIMQGGCVCENCSGLRVDTGNVELAAMFAPKPLALSGANDWTKDIMTKGFPELKEHYTRLGAEDKVAAKAWLEYGHQYNVHAREFMYSWFSKHLLGKDGEVKEQPYEPLPPKALSVYDAAHPRPKDELNVAKLREVMAKASDARIAALSPKDAASLKEYRRVIGTALAGMVTDSLPKKVAVREGPIQTEIDGHIMHRALLGRVNEKDAIPCAGVYQQAKNNGTLVIWAHPAGKASLFEKGKVAPAVKALTDAGCAVVATDLLGIGEAAFQKPFTVDKRYAGYTYGYNRPLLANRVHDLLTLVGFGGLLKAKSIRMVGWGAMGVAAILAKALAGDAVARLAADANRFRFEDITDTADPMMLPGAVKYGGLGAFLALCAPGEVFVHNHQGTGSGKLAESAYAAAGVKDKLQRNAEKVDDLKVVEWLVK
jgi:dienelactone hydrolase/pimeloyl-ACP methyl ester carboxylesterase